MDMKKILVLLTTLIIYTNYENYGKVDISKLHREEANLEKNIKREIQIQKAKHTKESLLIKQEQIAFNAKKYSYSKAMGEMQNQINESAKDNCTVKRIKWAQVPTTKEWYSKLRMNLSLSCKPKELFIFTNNLKNKATLYNIENLRISKDRRKTLLNINMQLVAFRINDESK